MKKALIVSVLGMALGISHALAQPDVSGVVSVGKADRARVAQGFVADDKGHVLARINAPGETLIVTSADGRAYNARQIDHDSDSGLSLLRLTNGADTLSPYPFARDEAEAQRRVYAIRGGQTAADAALVVSGSLAKIQRSGGRPELYLHNALAGDAGLGLPLFNNCGEVVGVVVPKPGLLSRFFGGGDSDRVAYALPIDRIQNRFAGKGLNPARADTGCISEARQAAAAEAQAERERAEAAAAAAEAEAAAAEAEAAAAAAQDRLQDLERELQQNANASEAERARLEEEIEQRRQELERAEQERRQAEEAKAAAEAERARLEDELEQARQEVARAEEARREAEEATASAEAEIEELERLILWGSIGGGVLLLILILAWAQKQRSASLERAAKARAEARAREAAANAAAAQADLDAKAAEQARIAAVPNVFFDMFHASGERSAVRVPGASIATAEGAVVGRNPSDSDFVINHAEVSRRHFRLFTDRNLIMIADMGATNSTTVDGKLLTAGNETVLVDRSTVQIGDLQLNVRLEEN